MSPTGDEDEDRFSFGTLHAALGQSFVQDRLKRQREQEERLKSIQSNGTTMTPTPPGKSPSEVTHAQPGIVNANDECRLMSS